MFFLNFEDVSFGDVDKGGFKEDIFVIERRIEADSFVSNIYFSSYNNAPGIATVELIQELLILCHFHLFLFNQPFFNAIFEFGFGFGDGNGHRL